jgi:hypothetical protein
MAKLLMGLMVLMMAILVSCDSDLGTMEIQLLKNHSGAKYIQLTYGSRAGFKNRKQGFINLDDFNKKTVKIINRNNIYIYSTVDIDFGVKLFRNNKVCGSYIFQYSQASFNPKHEGTTEKEFIAKCVTQ